MHSHYAEVMHSHYAQVIHSHYAQVMHSHYAEVMHSHYAEVMHSHYAEVMHSNCDYSNTNYKMALVSSIGIHSIAIYVCEPYLVQTTHLTRTAVCKLPCSTWVL